MALVFTPNCIIHREKPFSPRNPNFKSNHSRFSVHFPDKYHSLSSSTTEWRLRCRFMVRSNSGEDPAPQSGSEDTEVNSSLGVKAALLVLWFYKREISPLLPKSCRYVPTCSEYSMIAYNKYGFVKGSILTACRICRCNPLGGSGFDPPRWFDEPVPPDQ